MAKVVFLILLLFTGFGYSLSPSEEKQLIRDIAEIKATLKTFMEQTDKRFEQINNELNRLIQIMVGIFAGQIALVVALIGFAYWDRKTMIKRTKDETFEEMEKELKPEKFKKLLNALRDKAKTDKELEAILKKYGLL